MIFNIMLKDTYIFVDFDSTFVKVEALDELAKIVLTHDPKREEKVKKIEEITRLGMEGKISLSDSLSLRLSLFTITENDIQKLIRLLKQNITPSVARNKQFFKIYRDQLFIISGGFKEWVEVVVAPFGIKPNRVLANSFIMRSGKVTGYDKGNPLSQNYGKARVIESLNLKGKKILIGDGFTDLEAKKEGAVDTFYAFTENVKRPRVVEQADYIASDFDDFLYQLHLPRAFSYPKGRMKVLLLENIDKSAVDQFEQEGYTVETVSSALSEEELSKSISDVTLLGIRSKTRITKRMLSEAKRLLAIGAFCVGTDQIDLAAASQNGVVVFNAPFSNTRSVVELVIGEIIILSRKIFEKSNKLHTGIWDKTASGSHEVRGEKLGIIGYGNIGSQLSILAESLGMEVYFYDVVEKLPIGNAKRCLTLEELLRKADVVTVHVDGRATNKHLIGKREFYVMKDGVIFLNLGRGNVIDMDALAQNIKSGKIRGAAVDVFTTEPKSNSDPFKSPLQGLPNVILTPHIGGSTIEAQKNIAELVVNRLTSFVDTGCTIGSVNFPNLQLPKLMDAHRLIHIHRNVPGVLAKINNMFAKENINVEGQYLGTNEYIGYVITDVDKAYNRKVVDKLKNMPETIKFRILY